MLKKYCIIKLNYNYCNYLTTFMIYLFALYARYKYLVTSDKYFNNNC